MDQKKAYEQTISGKLATLPLPDMADAIWARIETRLDIDMPEDDGGGSNPPSGGRGWTGGAGLFVFVAALITTFFIYKNNRNQNTQLPAGNTEQPANIPSQGNDLSTENSPAPRPGRDAPSNTIPFVPNTDLGVEDTASVLPLSVSAPPPDTLQVVSSAPPPAVFADTSVQKKKRGVSGISDNDYRIVPDRKDSTRQ